MPPVMPPPPFSPVEPVVDVLHGVPITDPYRWLEDQNSPETREWIAVQTQYARAYLDGIPGRHKIRAQITNLLSVASASSPWKVRDLYIYLKRDAHEQQARIVMREDGRATETTLVDPNDEEPNPSTAVSIVSVSADARLLAYSIRKGGEDSCVVKFLDILTRKPFRKSLPRGFCRGVAFSPDNRGFYYSHEPCGATHSPLRDVRWHEFGNDARDREVFAGGSDSQLRLVLLSSPSGRRLGYYKITLADPQTSDFWIHDPASGVAPVPAVKHIQGLFAPVMLDNSIIALTDWCAPNRRIVRIDPANPRRSHWKTVVPECAAHIQGLAVTRELIAAVYGHAYSTRIETFDLCGNHIGTIPLPSEGTASLFPCRGDTDSIFFRFSSFTHPPSIHRFHITTRELETWFETPTILDVSTVQAERVWYPSTDGTPIPLLLVSRKQKMGSGPSPAFLTAYGGFGKSVSPRYSVYSRYLVEQGCLFAVANLRGGSEFGESWHISARRRNRQVATDDFLAAAGWLLRSRRTEPGRLAIGGGSNAGLLVGTALTQCPNLFRAAICLGPLLDMLRYHLFDSASKWKDEYGSAEIEGDFRALLQYSPYHRVQDGIPYPAVLFISGDSDNRCNPMHTRKMVARLQAATKAGPIMLDYHTAWGHMPVQPLARRIEALTDRLAFLFHQLRLDV